MKKTLLVLSILISTIGLKAQKLTDVVFLKNGSILKGTLVEQSDTLVKIETCCGSIFAFKPNEILKMDQETYRSEKALKEKGYLNYTSMGVLIGTGRVEKEAPFSLLMEHNYRFNKYFSAGLMAGLETLNETVLPAGINGKAMFPLYRGGAVYLGVTGGYSISLEKPPMISYYEITAAKGGILFNPEVGFIAGSGGNGSFFMSVGYRYNQLNYVREDYYSGIVERKQIYNRLSIKIGICFH